MKELWRFVIFFALMGFVVICNFLLFFNLAHMSGEEIKRAVPLTFGNVIFMTAIFCTVDYVRRYFTVTKPVKRIQAGIDEIMKGNFKTRIAYLHGEESDNEFDKIITGLNRMAEELGSVETLRTDFISNVSHEMKTPLAVIQNYGTLLQAPDISGEMRQEYARAVTKQTHRMSTLITNILKLNKLENQQIYPNVTNYDLGEQLCECMLAFENDWEAKEIEIETEIEDDVRVDADPELLSLVWNNLLSNAIKFTECGGRVSLVLKREGQDAVVQVRDTGCGMSAETGKDIFKKFYQGDTSHATEGNGLGLALVRRVIDISGGIISVSSKLGEGTTFTVVLPGKDRINKS